MRAGASRALVLRADALPVDPTERDTVLLRIGDRPAEPVANGADGAATMVESRFVLISPSLRGDCDIRCLCLRAAIGSGSIDNAGGCGELAAAAGLYAVAEGLVTAAADGVTVVRIWDEFSRERLLVHVPVSGGRVVSDGEGTTVSLDFLGSDPPLPCLASEQPAEILRLPDGSRVRASLIQSGSPTVVIRAVDFGLSAADTADALEPIALELLEQVRRAAAARMGLIETSPGAAAGRPDNPCIAIVSEPGEMVTRAGLTHAADRMHLCARVVRAGRPHTAFPTGVAVALAAGARIPGTVVHDVLRPGGETMVLGHAGGLLPLQAEAVIDDGVWIARRVRVTTTATRLGDAQGLPP